MMSLVSWAFQAVRSIGLHPTVTAEYGVEGESSDKVVTTLAKLGLVEIMALSALLSAGISLYSVAVAIAGHLVMNVPLVVVAVLGSIMVAVILPPMVLYQKCNLRRLSGLRAQQNRLLGDVHRLHAEITSLKSNTGNLEAQAKSLSHVENDLEEVANSASTQLLLDKLVRVMPEQAEIEKQVKKELLRDVLKEIIKAVFQSDHRNTRDCAITQNELVSVLVRLERELPGVILNKHRFQEIVATGGDSQNDLNEKLTTSQVLSVIRNILDQSIPDDKQVLQIDVKRAVKQDITS